MKQKKMKQKMKKSQKNENKMKQHKKYFFWTSRKSKPASLAELNNRNTEKIGGRKCYQSQGNYQIYEDRPKKSSSIKDLIKRSVCDATLFIPLT